MKVKLHAPTIEHVRAVLAIERAALPVGSQDIATRGAAVIAHDVMASIDGLLAGLATPSCDACAAKASNGDST